MDEALRAKVFGKLDRACNGAVGLGMIEHDRVFRSQSKIYLVTGLSCAGINGYLYQVTGVKLDCTALFPNLLQHSCQKIHLW